MSYNLTDIVSYNNGMKGEVVGSRPTGCVCNLQIKIKNVKKCIYVCMYVYQYKSIGTVSNNNGMKGEVVGSRPTGCVCNLSK